MPFEIIFLLRARGEAGDEGGIVLRERGDAGISPLAASTSSLAASVSFFVARLLVSFVSSSNCQSSSSSDAAFGTTYSMMSRSTPRSWLYRRESIWTTRVVLGETTMIGSARWRSSDNQMATWGLSRSASGVEIPQCLVRENILERL